MKEIQNDQKYRNIGIIGRIGPQLISDLDNGWDSISDIAASKIEFEEVDCF